MTNRYRTKTRFISQIVLIIFLLLSLASLFISPKPSSLLFIEALISLLFISYCLFYLFCIDIARRKLNLCNIVLIIILFILSITTNKLSLQNIMTIDSLRTATFCVGIIYLLSFSSIEKPFFKKDPFRTVLAIPITLFFIAIAIIDINQSSSFFLLCLIKLIFSLLLLLPIFTISLMGLLFSDNLINTNKKQKNVAFVASAGGHLTQITMLKPIFKNYNSFLITEKTPIEIKSSIPIKYVLYCSRKQPLSYLFKSFLNICCSFYYFATINPDTIITTGTHTAIPICLYGYVFRRKVIYIESFAKSSSPTLTGHFLYHFSDTFIIQWKKMIKFYPKAKYFGSIY